MKDTAVWLLSLAADLVGGTVLIGVLAGIGWGVDFRVASWVAG